MFAGAQVASRVSVPLCVSSFAVPSSLVFPPDGGVWSSLSSSLCARRYSFTSISISAEMRLRKRTSVLASNGASSRKPGSPIKYCRYGFSVICSTSSRSEYWNLVWMIRAPNAMRRGLATLPVSLGKSSAYLASNISHGIWSASLIQRLSGFMWRPKGWLKSRKECCSLSIGLYIVLVPRMLKICKKLQEKRFVFVKILAIIIPENGAKVSKIKCLRLNQQTLLNSESFQCLFLYCGRDLTITIYCCAAIERFFSPRPSDNTSNWAS